MVVDLIPPHTVGFTLLDTVEMAGRSRISMINNIYGNIHKI